jgi:hypothetical protein
MIKISVVVLVLLALVSPVRAEMATMDEALSVAKNWVVLIIHLKGDWGSSDTAEVKEIQELKLGEQTVGYFCRVSPTGNIVVSLRKELAPVKAYSEISEMDPKSEKKMMGFIKRNMQRTLDKLEKQVGPIELAQSQDVLNLLKVDQRSTWENLEQDVQTFAERLESGEIEVAYQPGEYLLSSNWQQGDPYNLYCPGGSECSHCPVGCVPLAGAQIMRYWAWPPDDFDWANMPDTATYSSPPEQQNAVAELCSDVGDRAGVDYECDGSSAWCGDKIIGEDMLDAYEDHFHYSTDAYFDLRFDNSNDDWFDMIMNNINKNRPLQYCTCESDFPGVAAHSLVLDGWEIIDTTFYGHMNDGSLAWIDMTDLPGAEGMIKNIRPAPSLGSSLSGTYSAPSFPFRYFDQDATGYDTTFDAGHYLQFLPGIKVTAASGFIRFEGTSAAYTQLFSIKGTVSGGRVATVKMYNGVVEMYQNGSIRFH